MKDITMCKNEDCPVCTTCLRYMALPNFKGQWYLPESATPTKKNGCDFYWDLYR